MRLKSSRRGWCLTPAFVWVLLAVVDALELLQALQIVVAEVLVGMHRRTLLDVLPGELPGLVAVLGSN